MKSRPPLFLCIALWCAACILAPAAVGAGEKKELTREEKARAYLESAQALQAAFQAKQYQKAIELCRKQMELFAERSDPHYNLACAYIRLGRADDAFAALTKSVELGYADPGHMAEDEDLAGLRNDPRFAELKRRSAEAEQRAAERSYEKGADLAGVKSIEGNPEGGLRWRLRLSPEATPEKPHRLIVWLHPSGGSMNRQAEAMSPALAKHGFALLVPTQKQWVSWSGNEGQRLVEKTIPDAAKVPGLDARKPLLMGYSAGGQEALELYYQDPARFGGLILDAAYPLDLAQYQRGQAAVQKLPDGPAQRAALKEVPLFVVVGTADGGSQLWKKAEEPYRAAGVPLTILYVKDGRHEWLLNAKPRLEALYGWLDQIAQGKVPKGEATPEPEQPGPGPKAEPPKPGAKAGEKDAAAPAPLAATAAAVAQGGDLFAAPPKGWPADVAKKFVKDVRVEGLDRENAFYHVWVPDDYTPEKAWPLVVVLHGGPNGKAIALASVLAMGFASQGALSIYPQALDGQLLEWNYPHEGVYLLWVIRQAARTYHLDPARLYLVGHSMGGGGCWTQGAVMSDVWAAVAPLSGFYPATPHPDPRLLKNVPLYCIQGADDPIIPARCARLAEADLKQVGNPDHVVRILEKTGHDIFKQKAELRQMAEWILTKKRATPPDFASAVKSLTDYGRQFQWAPAGGPVGKYRE